MMPTIRGAMPRSIAGQMILLVILAVALMHVTLTIAFAIMRGEPLRRGPPEERLAAFVRVLDNLPRGSRPTVAAAMSASDPGLNVRLDGRAMPGEGGEGGAPPLRFLKDSLGPRYAVSAAGPQDPPGQGRPFAVAVRLGDGEVVTADLAAPDPPGPGLSGPILVTLVFVALNVALLSLWAARSLTAPLTRFAQAAETFSLDRDPLPLPDEGPSEIRTAAGALNRLRDRIRRMLDDRTRMLAAVSHDLRTPITRMRLRAEFIADDSLREAILRDLEQMSAMANSSLSFLRDGQTAEGRSRVDIAALLQTAVDNFVDMGRVAIYSGPDRLIAYVRPDEISRAVANLIENALKYGKRATIRLSAAEAGWIVIDVIDDGPGIPEREREAMTEPFARGDASRNRDCASGGFGLGLAIVRSVAEAHGGTLSLHDADPHGLIARIGLPAGERP